MTNEQLTVLIGAIVGFLQVLTIAIGIWNKQHGDQIMKQQQRVKENLAKVEQDGLELRDFLGKHGYGGG